MAHVPARRHRGLVLGLLVVLAAAGTRAEEPAGPAPRPEVAVDPASAPPGADALLEAEDDLVELAEEEVGAEAPDPLEPVNRGLFRVNRVFDRFFFEPLARGYGWLVPDPGKRAVGRVFANLNEPVVLVNDLFQLRPRRALDSGARFVVNTTAGVGGLFDMASRLGVDPHHADFGQTLARAGLGPGAYLMLPLLGPSTVRDALGQIVDVALRPDTWLLTPGGRLVLASTGGVSRREAHLIELEELERSSVDYYAALRSVYLMHRQRLIEEGYE